MKGKKKLLSVLLAAALVGQMGVVVGMGTAEDDCAANEHGRKSPVATACSESVMHWIKPVAETLAIGGNGKNIFYVSAGDSITCGAGKNIIVVEKSSSGDNQQVEINNFGLNDDDRIYAFGATVQNFPEESEDESTEIIIDGITINGNVTKDDIITDKVPAAPDPKIATSNVDLPKNANNEQLETTLSVTLNSGVIEPFYAWEKLDENGKWIPIENANESTYKATIENTIGKTAKYRCSVTDILRQTKESNVATITVTGCEKTATGLKTIGELPENTTFSENKTISLENLMEFTGECNLEGSHDKVNHSYVATWTVTPENVGAKVVDNKTLVLNAAEFPEGDATKVTLTATLNKDNITREYQFSVKGVETESENPDGTTPDTGDGEGNKDPDVENPGGETPDPDDSNESIPPPPSAGDGEGDKDPKPDNPDPNQPDTKPETPPTITIGGGAENENSAPKKIEITKDSEDFSFDYNVTVSNQTNYKVVWTLKTVDNKDAPDYITVTPKDTSATVNIVKEKLPKEGVNAKFALTATLEEATIKAKARAAVADTKNSSKPSVTFDIEVKAEANLNQDTGGPAPTTCTRTIKSVTIAPKDTTPLHFKENDSDKVMDWTYTVEWNNDCNITNCTHKTEDLIWKVKTTKANDWAVLEGNVDTAQKSGKLKIITSKIPDLKDNKITFEAYTKKADGTEDKPVTITGELTITRDPRCEKVISEITGIQSMPGSSANVTVVKGKTVDQHYIANKKYSEGVCEKSPEHNETDGHGGTVTWKLVSAKRNNGTGTITDNEVKAFSVGSSDGSLHIEGTKLVAGKTYTVEIAAIPNNSETKAYKFGVTVKCTAPTSPGTTGGSSSSDDDTDDTDWYQWQDFEDDISDAKRGSTVKVNLRDNTDMPFYIFDEVRGRDVNLQMKVSGGYTWTVNGKTVKKLPENQVWVALGVDSYKNSRMSTLCRSYDVKSFQLENKGSFYGDMKLTMNVGNSYAKKTMFLYSYDEDKNKLTYCSSSKADDTGDVSFVFARSLGAYVVTSKALYGESAVGSGGGTVGGTGSGNSPTTVYPPVASVPASKPPASSSSSSSSSSQSSSSSEPAPPPAEPSSTPDTTPTDTKTEPEQKAKIPVLVPVLILSIAGVITATVLVVRSGRGKEDF